MIPRKVQKMTFLRGDNGGRFYGGGFICIGGHTYDILTYSLNKYDSYYFYD